MMLCTVFAMQGFFMPLYNYCQTANERGSGESG